MVRCGYTIFSVLETRARFPCVFTMDILITAVLPAETLVLFAPVQKVYSQNINKSFKLFLRGSLQTTNKLQIMQVWCEHDRDKKPDR